MSTLNYVSAGDLTAPVVALLLHGFGSHEHDLAGLGPLLPDGLPWASLRAPLEMDHGGAAWFPITTPGTPDLDVVLSATDTIWQWVDEHLPTSARVIPIGFSQGGLMGSQLLRTRPERIPGVAILGGFVAGAPQPHDEFLSQARPPVFWGRGADDQVITPHAIERTAQWLPEHSTLTERVYPGLGHGVSQQEMRDLRDFVTELLGGGHGEVGH